MKSGSFNGKGAHYEVTDSTIAIGPVYFYWLEESERSGNAAIYGPVRVRTMPLPTEAMASYSVPAPATEQDMLVKATAAELSKAGLPVDTTDASEYKAWIGTNEVPLYVSTWRGTLAEDQFVLFYCRRAPGHELQVSLGVGSDARRMLYGYAGPIGGTLYTDRVTTGGPLVFPIGDTHYTCLIMGLKEDAAWVLDVTDPLSPTMLYGYSFLSTEIGNAVYLSYFPETGQARCLLAEPDAVITLDQMRRMAEDPDAIP